MATQQAWMDEERKRHIDEFTSKPQSMTAICNDIRLKSGGQVHKDIIRAIVQITGYGKQHVKDAGRIEPRELRPDGTLCATFVSDFQALVDHFLVKLRAGILFFPKLLPDYYGWKNSFWTLDRPQWKDGGISQAEIRGSMLLMFEDIKNNGVNIDLTGAEVYQSFTTKDCDDCGSGNDAPGDDIVYCDTCHVGHHQSCYNIYPRPGPSDPWKCRVCEASKQASDQTPRKRKSTDSSTPRKKTTPKNVRPKEENLDYKDHHYKKASSEIQEYGMRRSSLDVPLKQRSTPDGRRVVSQPAMATPVTDDSKPPARVTPLNRLVNVPEEEPTSSENTSVKSRTFSVKIHSKSSTRSIKTSSEGTPSPEPRLHHPEIEGTILLTRLKDDNIFRKVLLTDTRDVITLFKVCAERWPEKFGDGGISRLLYIDEENHLVEIVKRSSPDYKEFLRMIQRRWCMEGSKEVIQVEVILLAAAENLEL